MKDYYSFLGLKNGRFLDQQTLLIENIEVFFIYLSNLTSSIGQYWWAAAKKSLKKLKKFRFIELRLKSSFQKKRGKRGGDTVNTIQLELTNLTDGW